MARARAWKPTLNETRPPAAIAKRHVVFRVMNAELNNMRCRHAHPPRTCLRMVSASGGRSLIEPFKRGRCTSRLSRVLSLSIKFRRRVFPCTHSRIPFPFAFSFRRATSNTFFTWSLCGHKPRLLVTAKSRKTNPSFVSFRFRRYSRVLAISIVFDRAPRKTKIAGAENKCGYRFSLLQRDCVNAAAEIKLRICVSRVKTGGLFSSVPRITD